MSFFNLWVILHGLRLARDRRRRNLLLELDSNEARRLLLDDSSNIHPNLCFMCKELLRREWNVSITQIYQEANQVTDGLASYGLKLHLGCHALANPPDEILHFAC
ncbi:hypothetical protein PTKIN_Ptkin15bG0110900 [Pterospermum kingtungense]